MAKTKVLICPYCGDTQPLADRCRVCGGLFEPLSRQATHNQMGPWYIRDVNRPFHPGCSYETLVKLIERGQVGKFTILRGPTTKQFWTIARRVPGVSHLLGYCHNCDASVDMGDHGCHACGVPFGAYLDRNYLGLPEIRPLPWEVPIETDDRMKEPASSRMMDFRRAAEPLGISSFASDAELRGEGGGAGAAGMSGGGMPGEFSSAGTRQSSAGMGTTSAASSLAPPMTHVGPGPGGGASTSVEHLSASMAARAAQMKMQEQRRLIQMLAIGLIVAGIVAITAVVIALSETPVEVEAPATTPPATSAQDGPSTLAPAEPEQTGNPTPAESAASQLPAVDIDLALAQAQEQIGIGEQEEIPIEERIAAYEEALLLLKQVEAHAADDQKPENLSERIAAVEKAIDVLRLQSFFP